MKISSLVREHTLRAGVKGISLLLEWNRGYYRLFLEAVFFCNKVLVYQCTPANPDYCNQIETGEFVL